MRLVCARQSYSLSQAERAELPGNRGAELRARLVRLWRAAMSSASAAAAGPARCGRRQAGAAAKRKSPSSAEFGFPSTAIFGLSPEALNRWCGAVRADDAGRLADLLDAAGGHQQLTLVYESPPGCGRIAFHRLTHLCAFSAAVGCARVLVGRYQAPIWCAKDTNESTVFHALCWGAHYQPDKEASYVSLYTELCQLIPRKRLRSLLLSEDLGGFRPVELAIKLRCFRLAVAILETAGVYQDSQLRGNLQVKRYQLHGYTRRPGEACRQLRNPVFLLSEMRKADFKELRGSMILKHPVIQHIISQLWRRNVLICILVALFWLSLVAMMQIPLEMQMQQATTSRRMCFSQEVMRVSFYSVVVFDLKVLEEVGIQKIRESRKELPANSTAGNDTELQSGPDQRFGHLMLAPDVDNGDIFTTIRIAYISVSLFLLLWHSVRSVQRLRGRRRLSRSGRLAYKRFLTSMEIGWMDQDWLASVCRFCLILFCFILCSVRIGVLPCPKSPLFAFLFHFKHLLTEERVAAVFLSLRIIFHLCYLFLHILIVYYLEMIPHLGPVVHAFRCMFSRFLNFAAIYLVVLCIFSRIFYSISFASISLYGGPQQPQSAADSLSHFHGSWLCQVFYTFSVSLNTERPQELVSPDDQVGRSEASIAHIIFVLVFVVLVLNFIIALLVSAMNEVNEFRDVFYTVRTLRMILQIDAVWFPVLARLSDFTGFPLTGESAFTTVTPV